MTPASRREIAYVEYSSLAQGQTIRAGAFLFTGLSLMPSARLQAVIGLESGLECCLNRPSTVKPRLQVLRQQGLRIDPVLDLAHPIFPLMLRFEHPAGHVESQPVRNQRALDDLIATMIMASYPVDRIWASECLVPCHSELRFGAFTVESGLDFCRIDYASDKGLQRVWRIDDGPIALLPRRDEESAFIGFAEQFEANEIALASRGQC